MVTNNPSQNKSGKTPEVVDAHPGSMKELRESTHGTFILKFFSNSCRPCVMLDNWLHKTYRPVTTVPVYHINVSNAAEGNFEETLLGKFTVSSLPTLVVTDKSLQLIDKLVGFSEEKTSKFLEKHFGLTNN
ncbi:thioredoxin 1 [Pancytospora epiphaga]|nr:thioredoxin 1 [Pancytospora epiphaga]